jgi:hypothetical protein
MPETSLITIVQLTLILFFLSAMVSILWSTIRYGIPPMPSNKESRQTMLDFVPEPTPKIMFDLGSGWGGFAYQLAHKYPDSTIYGYECSVLPFLFSRLFLRRENLHFRFQDFQKVAFPADSILFTYLYPAGMRELSKNPKLRDCWLCSNYFALEKQTALKQRQLNDTFRSIIYLYRID